MIFGMARGFCADFLPQMDTDLLSQIHTDKLMDGSCVLQLCSLLRGGWNLLIGGFHLRCFITHLRCCIVCQVDEIYFITCSYSFIATDKLFSISALSGIVYLGPGYLSVS
jgi:hypothetical protein